MISVLNRLPRLNGSNFSLLCLVIIVVLSGCSSTKPTTKTRTSRPTSTRTTKKKKRDVVKVDTIQWTDLEGSDGLDLPGEDGMIKKDRYNVSMFIPLWTRNAEGEDISDKSNRYNSFINYYAGVKMALTEIDREGIKLDVDVHDSESGSVLSKIRESRKRADLIIGPYSLDDVKKAADIGKSNELTLVSPWKATSRIKENPYYVQLLPNLYDHFDRIIEHATDSYDADNIFLVGRQGNTKDEKILDYMQNANQEINGYDAKALNEYYLETDSLINGETVFDYIFKRGETTVFIVANYNSKDEAYLHNCLRRINVEKGLNKVSVYTMPLAYSSDLISFDYYRSLDMKIVRSYYVDPTDKRVQQFKRDFFDIYRSIPTEEAFKGYDMMKFIAYSLNDYGREFQFHVGRDKNKYLQTGFDLRADLGDERSDLPIINSFVNKHLDILEFRDNRFQRSR